MQESCSVEQSLDLKDRIQSLQPDLNLKVKSYRYKARGIKTRQTPSPASGKDEDRSMLIINTDEAATKDGKRSFVFP